MSTGCLICYFRLLLYINFRARFSMGDAFLEEMEQLLCTQEEEIIRNLISENESYESLINDIVPKDNADQASGDIDSKVLDVVVRRELQKLNQVRNAIARIKSNHYGICIRCGNKISQDRLRAIPYATVCMDCKTAMEKNSAAK